MLLFILLCQIQSQQIEMNCQPNMTSFQIKDNHYCISNNDYATKNWVLQNSERENKLQVIVNEIEDLISKKIYCSSKITPEFMITNKFTSNHYQNFESRQILLIKMFVYYHVNDRSSLYDIPEHIFDIEIYKTLQPNDIYIREGLKEKIILQHDERYEIIIKTVSLYTIPTNICTQNSGRVFHLNLYYFYIKIWFKCGFMMGYPNLPFFRGNLLHSSKPCQQNYYEYPIDQQKKLVSDSLKYQILLQTFYWLNVFIFLNQPSKEKDVESQNSEQQSISEISNEVFSDYTDEFSDSTMIHEDIFINQENNTIVQSNLFSEIDKNSFYLSSQGESLEEEDQIPKYKEENVLEQRNQVNVNLLQTNNFNIQF